MKSPILKDGKPEGRTSLRKAINAYCRWCIYDPLDKGTCARQIAECTSTACPLWEARPKRRLPRINH
ncbi:MAG: hypothetical protein O3C28_08060, partial [Proteobacteria bacterium]|nr:hypothetical protein [Pseudomonadota bacterium]